VEGYKTRMLNWCRSQTSYARGRRARLQQELGDLTGPARAGVEALFSGFDKAVAAAEEGVRAREPLSGWEVARAMGYAVPA